MEAIGAMAMIRGSAGADDAALVRSCLDGHPEAFDALVACYQRGIYNLAYRMLGNPEDAADMTQETFVRAYSRLDTFDPARSFLTWIRRIATNLCIDHLRRRGTPDVSLEERIEAGAQHADGDAAASPSRALEMSEDAQRVLAAVQRLPERQRAVLVLRYIENLKIDEIARTLRMPVGTVKTMLFRGRQAVREMVGDLG
jgi:RNA polymerase sigma-70 factor (ECF subfamily)